jgi:heptosyltransferase-2
LFKVLRRSRPENPIEVLAPQWSQPLLERMPEVDRSIEMPVARGRLGLGQRYRLAKRLRGRYEQAILLPNSFKSALIPFWARIPRRTGYLGEMRRGLVNDIRPLDSKLSRSTAQRFIALADTDDCDQVLPSPCLQIDVDQAHQTADELGLDVDAAPILVICPGAEYGPAKRWPIEHWLTLVRQAQAAGWQPWLLGSEKDKDIGQSIARTAGVPCHDLTGMTRLSQAIDLLSLAAAVVSNDSGLMHVAAALDRPLVALFGSSDPTSTGPMSARAKLVYLGLECSPCFQRKCPLGHFRCMQDLTPDRVFSELEDLRGR